MQEKEMQPRQDFYKKTIAMWIPDRDAQVLVAAGGSTDKEVFQALGFKNVTISNLDVRMNKEAYAPYSWSFQDAESLQFPDDHFDYVVIHAALHHCRSPHRALLEMYRVARKGVIAFENRSSLLMRLMVAAGVALEYEHSAVFFNDCKFGGVANTEIPNFVYRWTEDEVRKTICAFAPYAKPSIHFRYGLDMPARTNPSLKRRLVYGILKVPALILSSLFPRQQNLFAFCVQKPDLKKEHFDWLRWEDEKLTFNRAWGELHYKKA